MRCATRCTLGLITLTFVGCSSPDARVATAEQAISAASTPEVEAFAKASLQGAVATMEAARQEITTQSAKSALMRRYGKARTLLDSATRLAQDAALVARGQAARRDAERDLAEARAVVAKVPADTAAAWLNARRELLTAAERSLAWGSEALNGGRYAVAADSLAAVASRLGDVLAQIKPTPFGTITSIERKASVKYFTMYLTTSGVKSEESNLKAGAGQTLLVISFRGGSDEEIPEDKFWVADSAGTRYRHKTIIAGDEGRQQVVYEVPEGAAGLTWNDGKRAIKL